MKKLFTLNALGVVVMLLTGCEFFFPPTTLPDFAYSGANGPEQWSELRAEWILCGAGQEQSPVNIAGAVQSTNPVELMLDYHETPAVLLNNGHTWELEYHEGSSLTLSGQTYELAQFHFHAPSEHAINGQLADMEIHLVHRRADGALAVIGILINAGDENAFLAQFWGDFPATEGEVEEEYDVNIADIFPNNFSYYTYEGSLTTPPCSEIVTWIVMTTPIEASQAQINALKATFGDNARPVQPLNGRTITLH